jgi:hypothetical protein
MRTGDHYHALAIDEVVHGVRKTEQMYRAYIIEHRRELGRAPLDQREGRPYRRRNSKPKPVLRASYHSNASRRSALAAA